MRWYDSCETRRPWDAIFAARAITRRVCYSVPLSGPIARWHGVGNPFLISTALLLRTAPLRTRRPPARLSAVAAWGDVTMRGARLTRVPKLGRMLQTVRRRLRLRFRTRLRNRWRQAGLRNRWLPCLTFLYDRTFRLSLSQRVTLLRQVHRVTTHVRSTQTYAEVLPFMAAILGARQEGVIVEAGTFKGGSTAKFSLAADLAGRELVVFDSFQGLPPTNQPKFRQGDFAGTLDEVRSNVTRVGRINACRFVPGWFEDTMPAFREPIAALYLDVDLAPSTRTCLKYLYPLLQPGGTLYSQDGHLAPVVEVFRDARFWREEVGCAPPTITAAPWTTKLLTATKAEPSAGFQMRRVKDP